MMVQKYRSNERAGRDQMKTSIKSRWTKYFAKDTLSEMSSPYKESPTATSSQNRFLREIPNVLIWRRAEDMTVSTHETQKEKVCR